jgi:hypothetical protein
MPIQSPQAYAARPFDEPQPTPPARKPPVLQQHDRKDFSSNSQYQKATNAANQQYERENQAYLTDKSQYDKDIQDWRSRKAAWDAGQEQKSNQSQAGQKRLEDYLASPEGKSQKNWNAGMTTAPMMPAALLSTYINKGMRNPAAKIGYGLLEAGAGEGLRRLTQEQQPDPYTDPSGHYTNQMWQNLALSSGVGAALGSIRSALMKPKPPEGVTPTEPTPAPVEPYKGSPSHVARVVADDLGLGADITNKDTKADIINRSMAAIKSGTATPEQIATVTRKFKGIEPGKALGELLTRRKPLAAIASALGFGAAAAVGSPGEAEAATTEPHTTPKPPEETSSDFSDLEREFGTGLPKGKAREVLKGAADAGSYMAPVVGEARMAADAPNLYNPSDEDLADAEYWQRGREEMANHLPEHEKAHLDNPQAAHDKAAWMLPYLRAGAEAQKRGEDFFGGSDQYDKELGALKQFYHGRQQAPVAPEAPTEEESPVGRKHGGSVNRKVISIHEAFKRRLEGQERKIVALEKAHARKASPRLIERLAKEKDEAKRIREHLERVKAHA